MNTEYTDGIDQDYEDISMYCNTISAFRSSIIQYHLLIEDILRNISRDSSVSFENDAVNTFLSQLSILLKESKLILAFNKPVYENLKALKEMYHSKIVYAVPSDSIRIPAIVRYNPFYSNLDVAASPINYLNNNILQELLFSLELLYNDFEASNNKLHTTIRNIISKYTDKIKHIKSRNVTLLPKHKDTSTKDTSTGDTSTKDTGIKDTTTGDTSTKDTGTKDTTTGDTSTKDTGTKDTSTKDTSTKDTSTKDTSTKDTGTKDTSTKDTGTKDTSTKDTGTEDINTKDMSGLLLYINELKSKKADIVNSFSQSKQVLYTEYYSEICLLDKNYKDIIQSKTKELKDLEEVANKLEQQYMLEDM